MGVLLAYFLGPGTAWRLTFEDVVAQVLKENCQQVDTQRDEAVTSLHSCNQRRALLHREIDASAVAQELTANTPEGRELAVKLMALRTALGAVEKAMMAHETLIEECRMQEEEARQTFHEEPEEELLDEEMVEEDDWDDPEPSGPCAEAGEEDPPPPLEEANPAPPEPQSNVITLKEDALLMQPALLSRGPAARSHSPKSEAGTVLGDLAGLSIASPGPTEPVGDETPQRGPPFCQVSKPSVRGSFVSLGRLRYSDGVPCHFVQIELEERSLMKNGRDEPEERGMRRQPSLFQLFKLTLPIA